MTPSPNMACLRRESRSCPNLIRPQRLPAKCAPCWTTKVAPAFFGNKTCRSIKTNDHFTYQPAGNLRARDVAGGNPLPDRIRRRHQSTFKILRRFGELDAVSVNTHLSRSRSPFVWGALVLCLAASHCLALDPEKTIFQNNCRTWTRQNGLPADGVN